VRQSLAGKLNVVLMLAMWKKLVRTQPALGQQALVCVMLS
jgi:hypothetical protein